MGNATALGDNIVVLIASVDTPFAAKRFCATEGLERVKSGSDLRDPRTSASAGASRSPTVLSPA